MIQSSERIAIISGEHEVSFSEMLKRVALFAEQTPREPASKVLILSENREGWIYSSLSVWANRGIMVPVDAGSTVGDVAYIIKDCAPSAIWVSESRRELVEKAIAEAGVEVKVLCIDDYENAAPSHEEAEVHMDSDATALICYTSGTTGSPKGVMLKFSNIMQNIWAVSEGVHIFTPERRTLILLPLHHVLPLVGSMVAPLLVGGGVIICPTLSGPDIMAAMQRGRVAIMIGVPRLYQTLFRGIKAKIDASPITRALYALCEKVQSRTLSRLIFKSVRAKMGGYIDFMVAGGAALDTTTAWGLKTLGLDVLEGYGMTETAPIIAFTRPGDIRPGCVGKALPGVELKLVDGELCARGGNVMLGYYNRPEETAQVIDADGWLHTGDLAEISADGHVTITGRKKEIIVLSNGKNVNPTEIEEKIEVHQDIVKECAVTEKDDLLCLVVVPQPDWAAGKSAEEQEQQIKEQLLQPYNAAVAPYKKLMSVHIHQGELPRTRLEKLQRFKIKDLVNGTLPAAEAPQAAAEPAEEYTGALAILATYISQEKRMQVKASDNLETDLAMDSLDNVALQGFIDQTFGVKIATSQLLEFATVGAIAQFVDEHKTHEDVEDIDWQKILHGIATSQAPARMKAGEGTYPLLPALRCVSRMMFHPEYRGLENIPAEGPFILAPNHQSFIDGPLVAAGLTPDTLHQTYFYAKKDHVDTPLRRALARRHNVIVMDMSTLSESIKQLAEVLQQGGNLVIFPEGTRTRTGRVGDFKKTFAILAQELGVPVVPVRISGAYEAWPRTAWLPRPHRITVEYLPVIAPTAAASYDDLAALTRKAIEA